MTYKITSSQGSLTEKTEKVDLSLSVRMKRLREAWGETQRGMAKILKCTLNTWQSYENGIVFPSPKILIKLYDRGVNANWVLTGEGEMQPSIEADWRMVTYKNKSEEAAASQWPFPWPYHPMLLQTVVEGLEESIARHGLENQFTIRTKAKTILSLYEILIPDYADGKKPITEDDGDFDERFSGAVKLIAG